MIPIEVKDECEKLTARPIGDVHAYLATTLESAGLWDSLDYFEISLAMRKRERVSFPNFEWISCAPVTSDGHHYIYIGTVSKGRHNLVFVGKTSKGFQVACEVANMCAHALRA